MTSCSNPNDSVSRWLVDGTRSTRSDSTTHLWQHFGLRLVRVARQQLRSIRDAAYGSEDLALSAFHEFHRCQAQGYFPNLSNRDQLWRLLVVISLNKARNYQRAMLRLKRSPDGASQFFEDRLSICRDADGRDSPDTIIAALEEFEYLLDLLDATDPSGKLRTIALLRFDGVSKSQIAKTLGSTRRTIDARIQWIQVIWKGHLKERLS